MNHATQLQSFLDNRQTADYLGFSPSTLNNSRYTGLLGGVKAPPFRKLGKAIRYERTALDNWLSQFKPQTSTSENAA
jgi:predicted DNA-binding transcriptional regulator AlpA